MSALVAVLVALLSSPAAAVDGDTAPLEGSAPFLMPLRREVTPVHHAGKLVSFKTSYSGVVHVGTPKPKELRVVFDTGSGHIVVPSVSCYAKACRTKEKYDPNLSTTSMPANADGSLARNTLFGTGDSVTIGFGKGDVRGTLVRDLVCLGPAPAPEAEHNVSGEHCVSTGIVSAYNMSDDPFQNFTFDGIVGLGLKSLAVSDHFSFLGSLTRQQDSRFSSGQFAVFLAEGDDEEESEIAFGGYNPAHLLEPLTWVPLAKPQFGYWMVDVLGVYVDDLRLDVCSDGPCIGILDTGTSHLGLPAAHVDSLSDMLIQPSGDLSDCRKAVAPTVRVELPGFNLTMLPENYMRRLPLDQALLKDEFEANSSSAAGNGTNGTANNSAAAAASPHMVCSAKLMAIKLAQLGPRVFLLGEPALHRYYTVYDAGGLRAGLGLAKRRKRAPEPEETEVSHDEIFLMQQMRGIRPKRPATA